MNVLLLLDLALKAALVMLLGVMVGAWLGRSTATGRCRVWTATFSGIVFLPVLALALPSWEGPWPVRHTNDGVIDNAGVPIAATGAVTTAGVETLPVTVATDASPPVVVSPAFAGAADARPPSSARRDGDRAAPLPATWSPVPILLGIWLGGVALCLGRIARDHLRAVRCARRARTCPDPDWQGLHAGLLEDLGIGARVDLLVSDDLGVPMTGGFVRPRVFLPVQAEAWGAERRHLVLLHELIHVRRRDCLARLLARIACALHWFNPIVWWLAARFELDRERSCDEAVIAHGAEPATYATHLLAIARSLRRGDAQMATILMASKTSHLERRLMSMLQNVQRTHSRGSIVIPIAFVAAGVLAIATVGSQASEPGAVVEEKKPAKQAADTVDPRHEARRAAPITAQSVTAVRSDDQPIVTWTPKVSADRRYIVVEPGDTYARIAQKHLGDAREWKKIQSLNRVDPQRLRVGQVLRVPAVAGVTEDETVHGGDDKAVLIRPDGRIEWVRLEDLKRLGAVTIDTGVRVKDGRAEIVGARAGRAVVDDQGRLVRIGTDARADGTLVLTPRVDRAMLADAAVDLLLDAARTDAVVAVDPAATTVPVTVESIAAGRYVVVPSQATVDAISDIRVVDAAGRRADAVAIGDGSVDVIGVDDSSTGITIVDRGHVDLLGATDVARADAISVDRTAMRTVDTLPEPLVVSVVDGRSFDVTALADIAAIRAVDTLPEPLVVSVVEGRSFDVTALADIAAIRAVDTLPDPLVVSLTDARFADVTAVADPHSPLVRRVISNSAVDASITVTPDGRIERVKLDPVTGVGVAGPRDDRAEAKPVGARARTGMITLTEDGRVTQIELRGDVSVTTNDQGAQVLSADGMTITIVPDEAADANSRGTVYLSLEVTEDGRVLRLEFGPKKK